MPGPSGEPERVLLFSPEAPYPLAGGGAMRTASLLHYLSQRAPADLIVFAPEGAGDPVAALPPGLIEQADAVPLPYHRRAGLVRVYRNASRLIRGRLPLMDRFCEPASLARVENLLRGRRYRLAVIEHFWCAEYVDTVRRHADTVVLDLHNVESALHAACGASEPFPQNIGHRLFHERALELERSLFCRFDLVLAASSADADRVRAACPRAKVAVYPNSIPLREPPRVPEQEAIAFSGNLEYHPNRSAVRFFATRVWRQIREKRPGLVWRLIGKNPHAVQDIVASEPGIELSGEVPDALPEIARARVVVVPVLAGSGTRVKIMEAWAAGRPVISSPIGAEGLAAESGRNILLADSPQEWVEQVLKLLDDQARRRELGQGGRTLYEERYCWPAAWRQLDEALEPLMRDPVGEVRER